MGPFIKLTLVHRGDQYPRGPGAEVSTWVNAAQIAYVMPTADGDTAVYFSTPGTAFIRVKETADHVVDLISAATRGT